MNVEKISSALLSASALAIAGVLIFRTFGQAPQRPAFEQAAVHIPNWGQLVDMGITISGDADSPVTLLEFADMECPACREFHHTLKQAIGLYSDTLRVVYLAFPLPSHKFAIPAARVVECANTTGNAAGIIDALYAKQDSIGLLPWWAFAKAAGVADSAKFHACASAAGTPPRVDSSLAMARRLVLPGTPSVVLNGWRTPRAPSLEQIDSTVAAFARKR